jgi:hypothetical protein
MHRRWVWYSYQADPSTNKFSILAFLETVGSIGAVISLAAYFDGAHWVLLASYFTPIFFLRSPESVNHTREYFVRAVNRPHRFQLYGSMVGIWLLYLNPPIWIWILFFPLTFIIGHLYNAWYVQFTGSILNLGKGVRNLPQNYYTTLFVNDITSIPEMFPGSGNIPAIPHWKTSIFYFPPPRTPITFFLSLMITITLIGNVLLRLVAKASAWLYLPIVYLSWPSALKTNQEEQMIWIKSQSAKSIELFRFAFSIVVVGFFFLAIFDAVKLLSFGALVPKDNPLGGIIALYYVTDLSDIKPWHLASLLGAGLSILVFFLMDSCRKEAIAGRNHFPFRVSLIVLLTKLRTLVLIIWILIVSKRPV